MLKRKGAGLAERTAVAGTLGEQEADFVEARDPSKRKEVRFAEEEDAKLQKR